LLAQYDEELRRVRSSIVFAAPYSMVFSQQAEAIPLPEEDEDL
jgi:hypothetical protein